MFFPESSTTDEQTLNEIINLSWQTNNTPNGLRIAESKYERDFPNNDVWKQNKTREACTAIWADTLLVGRDAGERDWAETCADSVDINKDGRRFSASSHCTKVKPKNRLSVMTLRTPRNQREQ